MRRQAVPVPLISRQLESPNRPFGPQIDTIVARVRRENCDFRSLAHEILKKKLFRAK